ncbi:hypothetical protein Tco_1398866 [Tanacetum coccineum]
MEALTTKIDSQLNEIKGEMKKIRDGCAMCGGPHPSSECDDKLMGGPVEEANYAYGGYPTPENKFKEINFEKTIREFMVAQKPANEFAKNQFFNLEKKVKQGEKNQQAAIHDLETKLGRVSDQNATRPIGYLPSNTQTNPKPSSAPNDEAYRPPPARTKHVNVVCTHSGKTYDPPSNPHDKITVIHDDSDDKAKDKAEEDNPTPSTLKRTEPIPMKAYKPRILYP